MSNAKHTLGPWSVDYKGSKGHIKSLGIPVIGTEYKRTPTVVRYDTCAKSLAMEEVIANANLIASAPELLEALEDMLNGWRYIREMYGDLYGVGWDRAESKSVAAVAKAKGEILDV